VIDDTDDSAYRDELTVMRDDLSVSKSTNSQSSWRNDGHASGSADDVDVPRVLKQRFVLEELIGSGGMGSVFRAKDLRKVEARGTQPFVAIKVLNNNFRHHPEAFIALEREATKSQTLRHPNIVSIFDFDKDADVPFITMELLEGNELAELLKSYPSGLPDDLAWKVIEGMVLGLSHAHEEGVVHADFKPGNIYVTNRKAAKILDFGIARAMRLNQGGEDTDFDPSRLAALTPAYASREMLNGDNPEPRDDLFSLGIVIYMVLTGHHPYGRVPANDAAREGLKPERIKQLSRRRWRIIEQCLQLNRQDRPESATAVYEGLFSKSAWRSWSVAATAGLVTASLLLTALQDNATINEVKEEVRQETLVEAQIARIGQLLVEPQFDAAWERLLFSEVQTLRTLAPGQSGDASVSAQIEAVYADYIQDLQRLDPAFAQLQAGMQFGEMGQASAILHDRLLSAVEQLSQTPVDTQWLSRAEQTLSYAEKYFPASSDLSVARLNLVAHLEDELKRLLASNDVRLAEQTWNTFSNDVFDEELWAETDARMRSAVAVAQQRQQVAQQERTDAQSVKAMADVLNVSCLRLDIDLVADRLHDTKGLYPEHERRLLDQVGERVAQCVQRLGVLDPDRAWSMHSEAVQQFGPLEQLKNNGVDPCSMHYLVGNGRQAGRGGFCADQISEETRGPRLVVVPGDEDLPKFAISKYEISWRDFKEFCIGGGRCTVPEAENLPVTGVAVDVIEDYAAWLSEKTGYRYRLPSRREWQQIAKGEPDPNRNCRVETGGLGRGETMLAAENGAANAWGLVHVLGNAQELVKEVLEYIAVGGTYSDPIDMCLASTQRHIDLNGDANTGFRLVREVS